MKKIAAALQRTRQQIRAAETEYGRPQNSVRLIAVSKTRNIEEITQAAQQGQQDFAENYLQEALQKIPAITHPEIIWHFIGPIQSNKTRLIAGNFHWAHTVDRPKTARRLNDARPAAVPPLNICIQINLSGETSKSGIHPSELDDLIEAITPLPRLRLRGLMALPALGGDFHRQCAAFTPLQALFDQKKALSPHWDTLSIGTTADTKAAIACGSTMVRIGTGIFGPRHPATFQPAPLVSGE